MDEREAIRHEYYAAQAAYNKAMDCVNQFRHTFEAAPRAYEVAGLLMLYASGLEPAIARYRYAAFRFHEIERRRLGRPR